MAPSTVRRVLAAADVNLPAPPPRPAPRERRPWPEWVQYRPNQVWGYDVTHFSRCRAAPNCFAIIDLVSRKWICALLSAEETSTQTQVVFRDALEAENLIGRIEDRLDTGELPDPDQIPILLAVCQGPVGSAQWRTVGLPVRGQQNCPVVARCSARGSVGQWRHPLPAVAWVRRMLSPAVMTTWAWWRSRSTVALAMVLGMSSSNPAG